MTTSEVNPLKSAGVVELYVGNWKQSVESTSIA